MDIEIQNPDGSGDGDLNVDADGYLLVVALDEVTT